ncbi:MAG: PAS domain S-box protein, partial [Methanospirillum sp.]|nr:PAS domain S-box protein [Methanospirillum sp.]
VYLVNRNTGILSRFLDQGLYRSALNRFIQVLNDKGIEEPVFTSGSPGYLSMTDMRKYDSRFTSVALIPVQRYGDVTGWFILASDDMIEVPRDIRVALEGVVSQIGHVISRVEAEEALRDALIESEERYMQLSETSPDAIIILAGSRVTYLNPAALTLFQTKSPEEFMDWPLNEYLDEDLQVVFDGIMRSSVRGQGPSTGEGFLKTRTGGTIYAELISVPISFAGEEAVLLLIRDKTGQRLQEEALKDSEKRFREMADLLPEPLFEADVSGKLTFCNRGVLAMLGNSGMNGDLCMASDLVSSQEQLRFGTLMRKVAIDMSPIAGDFMASGKAPDNRIIHLSLAPVIRDGHFCGTRGVLIDITEIKRYQERLHHMIEEKDVLFRELHHRVKNNMQIISSMLQLQEEYISDETILSALHDCEQRIDSMALVHETLYRTESLADIPFAQYLEDLAHAVTEGFATVRDIRTDIDVGGVRLSLDTAVTIGLIVNELMVNSMKYAFIDHPSGLIGIRLSCQDETCTFRYADDGIGLPAGFDVEKISSLGMRLVRILARQIRGKLEIRNNPDTGMECIVIFPK